MYAKRVYLVYKVEKEVLEMQWNLIRIRKEHNETQNELSELLGISLEGYRLKESGKNQFKSDEMFLISEHYGIGMAEIFLPSKYAIRKQEVV